MNCPHCGRPMRVTETRDVGTEVYRNRRCDPCTWLVTTRETMIGGSIPATAIKPRDWSAVNARRKARKAQSVLVERDPLQAPCPATTCAGGKVLVLPAAEIPGEEARVEP
jgi:transcriptional regulator NrdR family protein